MLACWLAPEVAPWCCSVRTQPHMRRGGRAGVGLGGSEDTGLCTELTAEAPGEMGLSGPGRMSRAWGGTAELRRAKRGPGCGSPEGACADGRAAFSPGCSTGWQDRKSQVHLSEHSRSPHV